MSSPPSGRSVRRYRTLAPKLPSASGSNTNSNQAGTSNSATEPQSSNKSTTMGGQETPYPAELGNWHQTDDAVNSYLMQYGTRRPMDSSSPEAQEMRRLLETKPHRPAPHQKIPSTYAEYNAQGFPSRFHQGTTGVEYENGSSYALNTSNPYPASSSTQQPSLDVPGGSQPGDNIDNNIDPSLTNHQDGRHADSSTVSANAQAEAGQFDFYRNTLQAVAPPAHQANPPTDNPAFTSTAQPQQPCQCERCLNPPQGFVNYPQTMDVDNYGQGAPQTPQQGVVGDTRVDTPQNIPSASHPSGAHADGNVVALTADSKPCQCDSCVNLAFNDTAGSSLSAGQEAYNQGVPQQGQDVTGDTRINTPQEGAGTASSDGSHPDGPATAPPAQTEQHDTTPKETTSNNNGGGPSQQAGRYNDPRVPQAADDPASVPDNQGPADPNTTLDGNQDPTGNTSAEAKDKEPAQQGRGIAEELAIATLRGAKFNRLIKVVYQHPVRHNRLRELYYLADTLTADIEELAFQISEASIAAIAKAADDEIKYRIGKFAIFDILWLFEHFGRDRGHSNLCRRIANCLLLNDHFQRGHLFNSLRNVVAHLPPNALRFRLLSDHGMDLPDTLEDRLYTFIQEVKDDGFNGWEDLHDIIRELRWWNPDKPQEEQGAEEAVQEGAQEGTASQQHEVL